LEGRVENLRDLHETLDLLFQTFCELRISRNWSGEVEQMRHWLSPGELQKSGKARYQARSASEVGTFIAELRTILACASGFDAISGTLQFSCG